MSAKQFIALSALAAITGLGASIASASITIPTVPIGNPGNAADQATGLGSVAYTYNIGSTEVTNAQYAAFLNAVAATDTHSLYHINMSGSLGGISRSGSDGSYTYAPVSGRADNPVNSVSFWNAARFANWLHNGQPSGAQDNGSTESGAYTMTPNNSDFTVTRNTGWQWAIASANEWYKAAYHQPFTLGGDDDDYWLYPTSGNTAPTLGQANYGQVINDTTPVRSYGANFYGTYDMCGNVWEWNDTIPPPTEAPNSFRRVQGAGWSNSVFFLGAGSAATVVPVFSASTDIGFRVVQIPGPSAAALLGLGGAMAWRRRRRA